MEAFVSYNVATSERDVSFVRLDCLTPNETDQFLLLREMHHRVANSFAILTATLRREFGASMQSKLGESVDRFEARVAAFGALHRFLTIGAETGWISAHSYIEQLCAALAEAILNPLGVRCEVSADVAFLPAECCEFLGLVIAELVTNSAKHAFQGRVGGLVRIEFLSTAEGWTCIVSDNGAGNSVPSIGVGSQILARLVRALGAELVSKSEPKGTSSAVRCPLQPEFSSTIQL
jgi:two-component sensor histidine kinase